MQVQKKKEKFSFHAKVVALHWRHCDAGAKGLFAVSFLPS